MINFLLLLLFVCYSCFIFFVNDFIILAILFCFQIILGFVLGVKLKKVVINILKFSPFIIFTFLINWWISDVTSANLITCRLFIVCNMAFLFSCYLTPVKIADGIKTLCYPLKWFHVNINDIALMITIAISFIPILTDELYKVKIVLKSRNFSLNLKNIFCHGNIVFSVYFRSVFKRMNDLDLGLNAKGYENN